MHARWLTWLIACLTPCHVWGSPVARHESVSRAGQDACGQVAALLNGKSASNTTVPAGLAWDCLQAVPLDATSAVAWLQAVKPYLRWQSTLTYLASPPPGYQQSAVDLMASVDNLITQVKQGKYSNENQFEVALYGLISSAHDQHLFYIPNMVGNVFSWSRSVVLVSASRNAIELPKVYVRDDILRPSNSSIFQPSAVAKVDGVDVNTYLTNLNAGAPFIDPDTAWNALFWSLPTASLSPGYTTGSGTFSGGASGQNIYPGASTMITFENGTMRTYDNLATPKQTFAGITSAQDVFNQYVVQSKSTLSPTESAPTTVTQLPGYPSPIAIEQNGWVSGYYLPGSSYQDVAVLAIPTSDFAGDFISTAKAFINTATQAGKTKLIIDLSANQGGIVQIGQGLFKLLFPDLLLSQGERIRATQEVNIIGQTVSDIIAASGGKAHLNSTILAELAPYSQYPLYYQEAVDQNLQAFTSWPSFFGPHTYHGDNFTSIFRYNVTANPSAQRPFKVENMVIVTDGQCGSTCSVFAEALILQAGIKTVVYGGRPTLGPMQAIGGTRGTNNIGWFAIQAFASNIYPLLPKSLQATFNSTALADYGSKLPFTRGLAYANSVNFRDGLRMGDVTETPLTFQYQAADCRIRQTVAMLRDITGLWRTVYDVTWRGQVCVSGGK